MPLTLRIRELRGRRGWTQKALAERAGVRIATISKLENQPMRMLDVETLERIARAFGVKARMLIR